MYVVSIGVVLLFVINILGLQASEYEETAECQDFRACVYNYASEVKFDDEGNQMQVSMEVKIACESEGVYEDMPVTRYCMDVYDVHISGPGMDTITEEMLQQASDAYGNMFCFLKNKEDGKIVIVYHPPEEKQDIVNFKKSIASAFQANLKKTDVEEETDAQSHHTSHYSYTTDSNGHTIEHRVVDESDVMEYAEGDSGTDSVQYHMEEDVELDDSNNVITSSGTTKVHDVGDQVDPYWNEDLDGIDENARVPTIDGESTYTLTQLRCVDDSARVSTAAYLSRHLKTKAVTDTLLVRRDKAADDKMTMRQLYKRLPSLDATVTRKRRDADSKTQGKIMSDWKRLLKLESQYGSLTNTPAKTTIINKLTERLGRQHPDEKQSRLTLYELLSDEGSLESQKALLRALESPIEKDEYSALILYISFASSADSSTERYLRDLVLSHPCNSSELLLAYGTLGRFDGIEDDVIRTLAHLLTNATCSSDKVVLLIHALGNTGSDKIVPIVMPFIFSPSIVVQFAAIDALRAVSRNEMILKAFASHIQEAEFEEQVIAVVRSLVFPFKRSLYFQQLPRGAGTSEVEQHLMDTLIDSSVRFQSLELNKAIRAYLKYVGTKKAIVLDKVLHEVSANATRAKRATSTDWNDSNAIYNAVASQASRTQDELDFKYNKAFLWGESVGTDDLHVTVAAGGFGGVGLGGYKIFARGALELHAWGYDFVVAELEYVNQLRSPQVKKFAKVAGTTYIDEETTHATIPYVYEYTKPLANIKVFGIEYHFWLYVATLNVYVEGHINAEAKFELTIDILKASASLSIEPSFVISGEASATIALFWKLGFDVTASLGYSLKPQGDIGFCTDQGDASTCLGLYTGPIGSIGIAAFYQSWDCDISWSGISCDWSGKNNVDALSATWDLFGDGYMKLLWGKCGVCNCPSSLGVICDAHDTSFPTITGDCTCGIVDL